MSARQRDELYAFKDETMDRIQAGDYNDPPKNFMDGAATRSEQWNYLTPTIKLKYIVQCDDPQLHQDKYVAAVELCKKHFFAMSCAILDKAVIELEQLDIDLRDENARRDLHAGKTCQARSRAIIRQQRETQADQAVRGSTVRNARSI